MKIAIIAFVSFVSLNGLALTKKINCQSPESRVGSFVKVEGELKYEKIDKAQLAGPYKAEGKLKIKTSRGLKSIEVNGQYDNGDSEYAHLTPDDEKTDIAVISLDFRDSSKEPKSYIEYTDSNGTLLTVRCGR